MWSIHTHVAFPTASRWATTAVAGLADAECVTHMRTAGRNASPPSIRFLWIMHVGNYTKRFCGTFTEHSECSSHSFLLNKAPQLPAYPTVTQANLGHRGLGFLSRSAMNELRSPLQQAASVDVQNRFHPL